MKKVVVVVDDDKKELFSGSNLKVDNQVGSAVMGLVEMQGKASLVIRDGDKILGEFQSWTYWREVE